MARSRGWELIRDEMRERKLEQISALRAKGRDLPESQYIRGFLDALDTVVNLPEVLIARMRQQ